MNTLPMHHEGESRVEKFNGPIVDREKLREGTYVAIMTAVASVLLVGLVKGVYIVF